MNDDRWHWQTEWVRDIDSGYEKNSFFKGKKWLDLQDTEDYLNELEGLLKEAHNKMDDQNAGNNLGLENGIGGTDIDGRYCIWCAGWPPKNTGYDGNGLIHDEDCILVKIRKVLG